MSTQGDDYEYADEEALLRALDEAQDALKQAGVRFLVMGGIASEILGRPRWTRDIDLFVRLEDAGKSLDALTDAGFETWVEHQHWLAKAKKHGVVVDVISRSSSDILLDDEMLQRGMPVTFRGHETTLVPPEDLAVMKAVAATEDTPRYWYDAIAVVGRAELDWDYLLRRARAAGVRRVLSMLLYAQSNDLVVPMWVLKALAELILGSGEVAPSPNMNGTSPAEASPGASSSAKSPDEYGSEALRRVLATDPRVMEPELQVIADSDRVVVEGIVPTEGRRAAVEDVLRPHVGTRRLDNRTEVASFPPPATEERVSG
jgi:predicted nucleotidyltransferase